MFDIIYTIIQSANSSPTEHVITNSDKYCHDSWYDDHNTCGKYKDINGDYVWASQVKIIIRMITLL